MKGKHHSGGHHGHHHKKAEGGRIGMKASGNPDVFKEAEGEEDYAKGDERKHGGKVKKKKHHEMHAEGKMAKHRKHGGHAKHEHEGHEKHHRAKGGRVGSDRNPLSSAHKGGATGEMAGGQPD